MRGLHVIILNVLRYVVWSAINLLSFAECFRGIPVRVYFVYLWCLIFPFLGYGQDLLKTSDIHKIMEQMLSQHVSTHKLTGQIVQSAIANYINQFDSEHIYLLESEIAPFLHLNPAQISTSINQYEHDQFSVFRQLDALFQKAIARSRSYREQIEKNKSELFHYTTLQVIPDRYATSEEELQERLKAALINYILTQKAKYGSAMTSQVKDRFVQVYEDALKASESGYLYENSAGEELTGPEKENLFALHVLKSLASSLDSHTTFYKDSEAYDLKMKLQKEFQGVGLIFKESPKGVRVEKIIPGGPADRTGQVKIGDTLLEVDGKKTEGLTFDEVTDGLYGLKGAPVSLLFSRESKGSAPSTYPLTLTRELVILKTDRVDVYSEPYGKGIIGRIVLHGFYQGDGLSSENDVRSAIESLQKKGTLLGLILDLRDNSGGFVSQAVKVAGLFITNGVIVISKYADGKERFYRDVDSKRLFDGPLIVLTSKATASAAEIVAQALQDYGVALVVGDEHTYGKGTIQTQTVTDNQSSSYFKVTVGKYYTASGKTPQKDGVKADIIVPSHWSRQRIGEAELPGAVEADKIASAFDDKVEDVPENMKNWYLKYYTPSLQKPVFFWNGFLKTLKTNSERRIAQNKSYQYYLKGGLDEEEADTTGKKKKYTEDDLQAEEADHILKDMILMQQEEKQKNLKRVAKN